jgi:PncC family amidohydrolase
MPDTNKIVTEPISDEAMHSLAQDFIHVMREAGLTFACAESCTGGLIASTLTDISGSSAVLLGGIVSYSNQAKEDLLGVPHETLVAHGAVSAPTAEAMAIGARTRLQSDYAISVTGIAGPNGGTPEKPVGLVYIGMATPDGHTQAMRYVWQKDRVGNKRASVYTAMLLILEHVRKSD